MAEAVEFPSVHFIKFLIYRVGGAAVRIRYVVAAALEDEVECLIAEQGSLPLPPRHGVKSAISVLCNSLPRLVFSPKLGHPLPVIRVKCSCIGAAQIVETFDRGVANVGDEGSRGLADLQIAKVIGQHLGVSCDLLGPQMLASQIDHVTRLAGWERDRT